MKICQWTSALKHWTGLNGGRVGGGWIFKRISMGPPVPRFLGFPLHNTEAEFSNPANDFVHSLNTHIQTRFNDSDPVAKATRFLDFFR